MNKTSPVFNSLELLKKAGAQHAQSVLVTKKKHKITAEAGKLSLLRSAYETELQICGIRNACQGQVTINSVEELDVRNAVKKTMEGARSSPEDRSYGISESQPSASFEKGPLCPDLKGMKFRLGEFLGAVKKYRGLRLAEAALGFSAEEKVFANSNGVMYKSIVSHYELEVAFSSSSGRKSSSVNFASRTFGDLSVPVISRGELSILLEQSVESLGARPVNKKFVGDIVIAPECLDSFLRFITEDSLRDGRIISGTSVYRDKLGTAVAPRSFTLRSMPVSSEITPGYFITKDGYRAEDCAVVENGVLRTFILSRYGAKKTGLTRSVNSGGCYVVDSGPDSLNKLIGSVKRGLLVTRFSGGVPNIRGDFSGIAKNSFYIENGRRRFPVSETMISGNIPEMFRRIKGISKERLVLGETIYPWIVFPGITVSSK